MKFQYHFPIPQIRQANPYRGRLKDVRCKYSGSYGRHFRIEKSQVRSAGLFYPGFDAGSQKTLRYGDSAFDNYHCRLSLSRFHLSAYLTDS